MKFRESLKKVGKVAVEELQKVGGGPDARSIDRFPSLSTSRSRVTSENGRDKHYPDRRKLQEYWELYQEVPLIRQPIRSFASEVIAPGYYIDAEDDELKEDIEDWLSQCAIVSGEIDKDFSELIKKSTVQREVKGTSLVEKVEIEEGNGLYGFKLLRPETIRVFTKPGQTVLLPPDYDYERYQNQSGMLGKLASSQDFYTDDEGNVAAYVQLDNALNDRDEGYYIPFTRNKIIKLTRDADVGQVLGRSRIAAVEDRLLALLKKLEDNDKAIESLAHPFQLFKFGSEDSPWSPEEIQKFMDEHDQSNFEPGMKQGVQGDLSVETVSGEVAPIEDFLDFDLNYIITEMPMPRYALGGFESEVNQFVSRSQEQRLENQLSEARNEIEREWNPVIEQKVEEMGHSVNDFNSLKIGQDPEEINLVKEAKGEDNIPSGNNSNEVNSGAGGTDFTRPPASSEDDRTMKDERDS